MTQGDWRVWMKEDWEVGSVQILEILDEGRGTGGGPCEKNLDWDRRGPETSDTALDEA